MMRRSGTQYGWDLVDGSPDDDDRRITVPRSIIWTVIALLGLVGYGAGMILLPDPAPEEQPTRGTIHITARGQHAPAVDSVWVVVSDDRRSVHRVIPWLYDRPVECVTTTEGQRGWIEVVPHGAEIVQAESGAFLQDETCHLRVDLRDVPLGSSPSIQLRTAGVVP